MIDDDDGLEEETASEFGWDIELAVNAKHETKN